ncbi:MAG: ribonuclease H-like domain-containing protein [Planctomycetota bacterium]|jgi:uncharacterized protein YprB with RNaseH-like and TPR domain
MICRAYLDIETTGFSRNYADLTVVGLALERSDTCEVFQLVGDHISASRLLNLLKDTRMLYTYNGSRFDLPFIKTKLGLDLKEHLTHRDLMYDCWRKNLYGGLKKVEQKLGIARKTEGIDGRMAVRLWYDYKNYGNRDSLKTLLEYNKEDILNLAVLRKTLNV